MKYSISKDGKLVDIVDVDTICTSIKELVETADRRAQTAMKELARLREEKWKDEELQSMKEQLIAAKEEVYRGFPISEAEAASISEWKDRHYTEQHNASDSMSRLRMQGVSGGLFSYVFLPTSIGTSGICRCNACYRKAQREIGALDDYPTLSEYLDTLNIALRKYDAEFEFQELG